LILLHEAAHALAGRRLGLPSRLSVSRRLHYVVAQTTMDGLVAVPRRSRFLPILAGMLCDLAVTAVLTLGAAVTRHADGAFPLAGSILLALAYLTLLRLVWQCWFFLQTDIYYLVVTVLGCVDLQATTRQLLANWMRRRLGRPARYDPNSWHPRDRAVARWYSVLMVIGYGAAIAVLLAGVLPVLARLFGTALARITGGAPGGTGLLDSIAFLVLAIGELVVAGLVFVRERRRTHPRARSAADQSTP
jgi:hypothetical protein